MGKVHTTILLTIALLVAVATNGCYHSTSPSGSGMIAGRVALFDSTGFADSTAMALPDFSGVTVSIDGTSLITMTDSYGRFEFDGLADGTYDVTATKSGFGTFHWFEREVVGGRHDLETAGLGLLPSFTPVIVMVVQPLLSDQYVGFQIASLPVAPYGCQVMGYCDTNASAQPSDPHLAICIAYIPGGGAGSIHYNDLRAAGAHSGQTLYLSASTVFDWPAAYYPGEYYGPYQTHYYDPLHHVVRWGSYGHKSNVMAVKMP